MGNFKEMLVSALQADVLDNLESVFFDLDQFEKTNDGVTCPIINVSVGAYYTLNEMPMYYINNNGDVYRTRNYDDLVSEYINTLTDYHDHW